MLSVAARLTLEIRAGIIQSQVLPACGAQRDSSWGNMPVSHRDGRAHSPYQALFGTKMTVGTVHIPLIPPEVAVLRRRQSTIINI